MIGLGDGVMEVPVLERDALVKFAARRMAHARNFLPIYSLEGKLLFAP
jgi:hypothetical protein